MATQVMTETRANALACCLYRAAKDNGYQSLKTYADHIQSRYGEPGLIAVDLCLRAIDAAMLERDGATTH